MKTWAGNVWFAVASLGEQTLLALDQLLNAVGLGLLAVLMAALTGGRQAVAFADETLSAHAHRALQRGRVWGLLMRPLVDAMFFWQKPDEQVNQAAGRVVSSHCERAYWKERLRRNLPPEYRDGDRAADLPQQR